MINAWHLLWIVPLSMTVGAFMAALAAGKKVIAAQRDYDELLKRYNHEH